MNRLWLAGIALTSSVLLHADSITLRNGKTNEGTFLGGNARQIDFLTAKGE